MEYAVFPCGHLLVSCHHCFHILLCISYRALTDLFVDKFDSLVFIRNSDAAVHCKSGQRSVSLSKARSTAVPDTDPLGMSPLLPR